MKSDDEYQTVTYITGILTGAIIVVIVLLVADYIGRNACEHWTQSKCNKEWRPINVDR